MTASDTPVPGQDRAAYHRGLHIAAVVLACAVFPLIFVGAGVTSKDAGMAFPDWPTSAGHIINPPQWWQVDDTRWEHGHRLIGWLVGMLAILVACLSWGRGRTARRLSLATLGAIIIQGVMGGFRVIQVSTFLAMLHGIWGQACFCLACVVALTTSRTWTGVSGRSSVRAGRYLQRLCLIGSAVVFVQLVLGAALRHYASDGALIAHVLFAVVVTMIQGWIAMWVVGQYTSKTWLGRLGRALGTLMIVQLFLGGFAFLVTMVGQTRWSPFTLWAVPTAHVAVGALLLVASVLMTLSVFRMLEATDAQGQPLASRTLMVS